MLIFHSLNMLIFRSFSMALMFSTFAQFILLTSFYIFSFNPFCPDTFLKKFKIKVNFIFIFAILCGISKGLMKAFTALRKWKKVIFSLNLGSGLEGLICWTRLRGKSSLIFAPLQFLKASKRFNSSGIMSFE